MKVNLSDLQPPVEAKPLLWAQVTADKGSVYLQFMQPGRDAMEGDRMEYGLILDRAYAKDLGFALCDVYLKAVRQGVEGQK